MTTRRLLLLLFAAVAVLGVALMLFASVGDAGVTASTAGVYTVLEERGLQGDTDLLNALYSVVLRLNWPYSVVQLVGLVLVGIGVAGVLVVRRRVQ